MELDDVPSLPDGVEGKRCARCVGAGLWKEEHALPVAVFWSLGERPPAVCGGHGQRHPRKVAGSQGDTRRLAVDDDAEIPALWVTGQLHKDGPDHPVNQWLHSLHHDPRAR